jgi:predicted DNA-binding protein YlxM (UPF0122 family)
MAIISNNNIDKVKELYYKKLLSARQIAEHLNVSIDAVYYCMRHNGMKRRSFSEDNKIRFDRKPTSFKIKDDLSKDEDHLKIIGTVLYWGEGHKSATAHIVDFANSDPDMVKIFVHFLRMVCGVQEDKLRVYLYCHSNQNTEELIDFWSSITKIKKDQFTKPYIRKDFNQKNIHKMLHGLVHIRYGDKKLLLLIKKWIEEYKIKFQ